MESPLISLRNKSHGMWHLDSGAGHISPPTTPGFVMKRQHSCLHWENLAGDQHAFEKEEQSGRVMTVPVLYNGTVQDSTATGLFQALPGWQKASHFTAPSPTVLICTSKRRWSQCLSKCSLQIMGAPHSVGGGGE
jgi:hypothetical protein